MATRSAPARIVGERDETASRLDELEELYRNTPVGLCAVDRELRYVRANEIYAQIVGRAHEDLMGRTMEEVIPASASRDAVDAAARVIATGEPLMDLELRRVVPGAPDLNRIWLANIHPVRRGGEVVGAMAVLQDVTAIRRSEEETQDRLAELESVYRNVSVGLAVVDRELRYVRVNEAFAEIAGHRIKELVGRRMHEMVIESIRQVAITSTTRVIETGEPLVDMELLRVETDDPARDALLLINVHAMRSAGEIDGAMIVLQNITSLRRAEGLAQQRLAELESVYRSAPVGLSFIDSDLRYLRVNQAIADMNGIPIEEMVGKFYRDLSPESADVAERFLKGIVERGASVRNLEVQAKPPTDLGALHDYLLGMDPVRGADGEIVGYSTSVQDVTQLRRAERNAEGRLQELEALYAAAPVGLCHVDADLQIVHVNPLFAAVGDRPLDDQIGAKVHDVLPGKISAQLIPQIHGVQAGASLLPILIRARLPDRGSREYAWVAQVHPIASGSEVTGVIIALQDVTVLTERQRQVETMRDHLAEAQHEALVGSWDWNVATDEIWWSPELRELFGVDSSYQASYDAFYEFVHPDDREKARQQLERVLENEIPERAIFRIIRDDGQERTLSTSARLERTEAGQPGRLIGTCQDVTEFDPLRRKRRRKRGRRGAKR